MGIFIILIIIVAFVFWLSSKDQYNDKNQTKTLKIAKQPFTSQLQENPETYYAFKFDNPQELTKDDLNIFYKVAIIYFIKSSERPVSVKSIKLKQFIRDKLHIDKNNNILMILETEKYIEINNNTYSVTEQGELLLHRNEDLAELSESCITWDYTPIMDYLFYRKQWLKIYPTIEYKNFSSSVRTQIENMHTILYEQASTFLQQATKEKRNEKYTEALQNFIKYLYIVMNEDRIFKEIPPGIFDEIRVLGYYFNESMLNKDNLPNMPIYHNFSDANFCEIIHKIIANDMQYLKAHGLINLWLQKHDQGR